MRIAILTFDGFNEIDSFVALNVLNRVSPDWTVQITSPTKLITSKNGVTVQAQQPLEFANTANVVLMGSGTQSKNVANDVALLARLHLNPQRQLIASQCSGALILEALGLLASRYIATDAATRPDLAVQGYEVVNGSFFSEGNVATAGGCLASHYLATWIIWRLVGQEAAENALRHFVPVGEEQTYIARAIKTVQPFINSDTLIEID